MPQWKVLKNPDTASGRMPCERRETALICLIDLEQERAECDDDQWEKDDGDDPHGGLLLTERD